MIEKNYKIGSILENYLRQFTKVISYKRGLYGLSGWTTRDAAEKATIAREFLNKHGLRFSNIKVVKVGSSNKQAPVKNDSTSESKSEAELKKMKAPEVKALADTLGLDSSGKKEDVIKRILKV